MLATSRNGAPHALRTAVVWGITWAFLLWAMPPAAATVLFAGGEDIDFSCIGACTTNSTAGYFRSGYARTTYSATVASSADPPTNRFLTPTFTNSSTIWIHAENYSAAAAGTTTANQAIGVYGSGGVRRLLLRGTGTTGQVKISTRNSAGTITDLVTCTSGGWPTSSSLNKLDWYINYAVAGHTTLYSNGVQICDYSGDITTDGVTSLSQVDFANPCGGACAGNPIYWSEIIVATTDTRDMNLFTCYPAANGTNMAWSGSYTNVNPTTVNDGSAITTASAAQVAEFTCPSLPSGQWLVPAVAQSARIQIGTTGPQHFRWIVRPAGGSDYDNGSDESGTTSFGNYYNIWPTNPATSGAWAPADIGTGFNEGIKSAT